MANKKTGNEEQKDGTRNHFYNLAIGFNRSIAKKSSGRRSLTALKKIAFLHRDQAEFEKIKEHPVIGANILKQLGMWEKERQIIRCHHERFDGTGYPDGLKGDQIPFLARILTLADVYDAMASDRAYRKRMEEELILKIIREGAGTQFDPDVVAEFNHLYDQGIILRYMESNPVEDADRFPSING